MCLVLFSSQPPIRNFFFFNVWAYLFVTLRKSYFWCNSDLEVEVLREGSLRLVAISSWHFSLASFIFLAKSWAYSAASSLVFLVRCFFRAIHQRWCCRMHGVTRRWILGALVLGFLPSLFRVFSHNRLADVTFRENSLWILLVVLGPKPWGGGNIFLPLCFLQWPSWEH